ncbi:MAG TPA: cytochrome c [Solirubrobacterales bacterium]|nr:cytochrome c [Solirubrobacterales bacterium]
MTETKTSKALILLVIVLALPAALVVAGCGGGGSSSSPETTTTEGAATQREERSGESSLVAEGKTVFSTTCASCHTLKAAGATGEVGPDLDELEPSLATVEHQVVNGGGGMPAFGKEGTLNAKEIKAVATSVSAVAGRG